MLKSLRSLLDYILFFELELSDRKVSYIATLLGGVALGIVGLAFPTTTQWGDYGWLALPVLCLGWIMKILSATRPGVIRSRYEMIKARDIEEKVKRSRPHADDVAQGWRAVEAPALVQGSIHTSRDFNLNCMLDPQWDVVLEDADSHYQSIVAEIRKNRDPFKQYAIRTTIRKIFGPLPLVNESKIAIASDFRQDMTSLKVFQSSYFATLCSGDLAHRDIIEVHATEKRDYSLARHRIPFTEASDAGPSGELILQRLSTACRRVSTQIGINVLGITSDNILLIATQGGHNLHGPGARVPLATGSMDWEDRQAAGTFKQLGEIAALRELREEWGQNPALRRTRPLRFDRFVPVGVFRVPGRAGKPEFAAIGRLNWSTQELKANRAEVDDWAETTDRNRASHRYPVESLADFTRAIDDLLVGSGREEDTAPLFGVLTCIKDAIEADPEGIWRQLAIDASP